MALGSQGIEWSYAAALLAGGVIAAPIAAWLVRWLPGRILGVLAGGLIVLTNIKTIAESLGADGWTVVWLVVDRGLDLADRLVRAAGAGVAQARRRAG